MVFVDLIGERKQRKNQRRLVQFHRLVQLVVHRCEPLRLRRTELSWALADRLREGGQEYGASTGRARRCGWFDAVVARYFARINGLDGLALTKLDVLDGLPEVLLCTGYRTSSGTLSEFPADLGVLASAEPIYETLPGWSTLTKGATRMEHASARDQAVHRAARRAERRAVRHHLDRFGSRRNDRAARLGGGAVARPLAGLRAQSPKPKA